MKFDLNLQILINRALLLKSLKAVQMLLSIIVVFLLRMWSCCYVELKWKLWEKGLYVVKVMGGALPIFLEMNEEAKK